MLWTIFVVLLVMWLLGFHVVSTGIVHHVSRRPIQPEAFKNRRLHLRLPIFPHRSGRLDRLFAGPALLTGG